MYKRTTLLQSYIHGLYGIDPPKTMFECVQPRIIDSPYPCKDGILYEYKN